MERPEPVVEPSSLSKRAARRLIQRAFVLAARDRTLRQHIRETRLLTHWRLGDWNLQWTLLVDRGKLHFERRPAKHADVVLEWYSAEAFFRDAGNATRATGWPATSGKDSGHEGQGEIRGEPALLKALEPVYYAFCAALREVLARPLDEQGDPLI